MIYTEIYQSLVPEETRFWLYKLRNYKEVSSLKSRIYPSPKGDFSLRRYYDNRCVFVHITKAAGTSLALSLFGELPYHYRAWEYRVIYGRKDFNRFFKFTFVRNPWDRLYSAYSYLSAGGWNSDDEKWSTDNLTAVGSFRDFVLNWLTVDKLQSHIHLWPQYRFICDKNYKPLVNYLGYFETIKEDFSYVAKILDLDSQDLQHTNTSKRDGYEDVYDQEMIDKVHQIYMKDIELFGYSFDGFKRISIVNGQFHRSRDV